MLTAEQIKFMKENRVPWGLMTEEEKGLFGRVKKEDTVFFVGVWEKSLDTVYSNSITYRLRPDWEPEPENVEIPDKVLPNLMETKIQHIEKNVNEILYLFKVMDEWSKEKIGNINSRMGRLEAREGKMSKTEVSYVTDNIAKLRKRIEELEAKK